MITLRSGVPGSGKTLSLVHDLARVFRDLEKGTVRPVYTHGIPDLALPCMPLPVFAPVVQQKGGSAQARNALEVDWSAVPDGAMVIVDEAQHIFPPRGAGSSVPGYVAFLNTHRHRGIDIELLTQHPKLLDGAVRKLIGRHIHYRRLFGGSRHIAYEWDNCSEALSYKTATKGIRSFPKSAFKLYKSAELHTKQKFKKPAFLLIPVFCLVAMLFIGPRLLDLVQGKSRVTEAASTPAPAASSVSAPAPAQLRPHLVAAAWSDVESARVAKYDDRYPAPQAIPYHIGGCWIDSQCRCVTVGEGRPRILSDLGQLCVDIAHGRLVAHAARPEASSVQASPAASPSHGAASGAMRPGVTAAEAAAKLGLAG